MIPNELLAFNMPVDAPLNAVLVFKILGVPMNFCSYAFDTDTRKRYLRTSCSTTETSGVRLEYARLEVEIPASEGQVEATFVEPPPCANSPRSVDKKTVIQGGRFFPGSAPTGLWVAVLDEAVVPEQDVASTAVQLTNSYGVTLGELIWGPYGFTFTGSSHKAAALALSGQVRFVETMVEYRGAGWSKAELLAARSWAVDRLDQREAENEVTAFVAGPEGRDQRFRYPETSAPIGQRPQLFVLDTTARVTHAAFAGLPQTVLVPVPGARPQCGPGNALERSYHGTAVLSNALGGAGTFRLAPRQSLQMVGLGSGGAPSTCDSANQAQVVNGLVEIARQATAKDVVVLSFGSTGLGMQTEMAVNGLARTGVLVFAATGNEATTSLYPPASSAEAFAIGAVQEFGPDPRWSQSNGLATDVDFHAPGVSVLVASDETDFATRGASGTSYSTPLVTGIAAYYATNGLNGTPEQLRELTRQALLGNSRTRTPTGIVVPFTPTQPLFGPASSLAPTLLASALAYDEAFAWVGGLSTGTNGAALLRVPVVNGEPVVSGTQVLESAVATRCDAVAATAGSTVTSGCWSPSMGGKMTIYESISGGPPTVLASVDIGGLPLQVASDQASDDTTFPIEDARGVLSLPVDFIQGSNPVLGSTMRLTIARKATNGWFTDALDIGSGYQSVGAALAVNCPERAVGGTYNCDAFILLTHVNNRTVRLFKLTFDYRSGVPLPPVANLLAERTDSSSFFNCFVPGWASGEGLSGVGLAVDDVQLPVPASRWSFAVNRLGTNYINGQCASDSTVTVVNDASPMLDLTGPRGEAWMSSSRSTLARTTLAVGTVWNPVTNLFEANLRSAIRTMHPRGSAPVSSNVRFISHSPNGQDAMSLSTSNGTSWSIASVKP